MLPGIVCQLFDVGTLEESIVTMWSYLALSRGYTLKDDYLNGATEDNDGIKLIIFQIPGSTAGALHP